MAQLKKIRRMVGIVPDGEPSRVATVYYSAEWEEFIVRFEIGGVYQAKADYHTDCRDDAESTAGYWLKTIG